MALEAAGVHLVAPVFSEAGTSLDVPSLTGAIIPALEDADGEHLVIVDLGGDDGGATALGRFGEWCKRIRMRCCMSSIVTAISWQILSRPFRTCVRSRLRRICMRRGLVDNAHLKDERPTRSS